MVYLSADILGRWGDFLSSKTHFSNFSADRGLYKDGEGKQKKRSGEGNAKCHFLGRGSPRKGGD